MSLETVVEVIREEARARAREISEETDAEIQERLAAAEDDADAIIEDRQAAVEEQIEREREQAISGAKLEAKQARLATRRDLLEDLRESVEERISSLEGERREALTRPLLEDAITEYPEDADVHVRGAAADEALLTELVGEFDNADYDGTVDCLGGVEVSSPASRVTIDNTFDAILDDMWDDHLKDLSAQLFESEQ